jgi:phage repressor protein C with HTH and peptisase S24 domain
MELPVWKRKLKEAVDARFAGNMKAASLKAGLSETYLRDVLKRGRVPTLENFARLAEAFGLPLTAFLTEEMPADLVPVVGDVGAGAETHLYREGQGPFDWVRAPRDAKPGTVAVRVRGTSMAGLIDDGALLFYDDRRDPPTADMIGALAVIGLSDGRVVVKKLYKGAKRGRWNLISTNDNPLLDVAIDWAAKVTSVRMA